MQILYPSSSNPPRLYGAVGALHHSSSSTHPPTHSNSFVRILSPSSSKNPLFMGLWEPYTSIWKRTTTGFGMVFR